MRRADSGSSDISDDVDFVLAATTTAGTTRSNTSGNKRQHHVGTPSTGSSFSMSCSTSSPPRRSSADQGEKGGLGGVVGGMNAVVEDEEIIEELNFDATSREALSLTTLLELDATSNGGTAKGELEALIKRLESGDLSKDIGSNQLGATFSLGGQTFTLAGSELDGYNEIQAYTTLSELLPYTVKDGTCVLSAQQLLATLRKMKASGKAGTAVRATSVGDVASPQQYAIGKTPMQPSIGEEGGDFDASGTGGILNTVTGQLRRLSMTCASPGSPIPGEEAAKPVSTSVAGKADQLQLERLMQMKAMKKANNIKRRVTTPEQ